MTLRRFGIVVVAAVLFCGAVHAESSPFREMHWRSIGPFRGGRTVAAVGVPGNPDVFYIGVNNGGVWKSNDYGRIWTPIFDDQPTGSIGAIGVAASNPDIVYVGSGEGLQRPDLSTGDGIYKSSDAGKTWTHLGLRDAQQIAAIVVDPHNADRLFVAALGHPYGPNAERGIFRSLDGGKTFEKVLFRDENTGGIDVIIDPSDAQTVYAALWESREAPWENGRFEGSGSGLFKSTDGGTTWSQLTRGLPSSSDELGRIGIEVSRSNPHRLYAIVDAATLGGVYRSEDGGESWMRVNADMRLWGRGGDFNEVRVDPSNSDIVYVANVVTWKSTDGGKTFSSFRGAPGGDDYHRIWINPANPKTILIASDQGAIVTVNGGESWSSWYNQPTAQMFHVNADNDFPYRLCGGQQESGSACVQSRSDDGRITFREWHPVGVEEYGYAVPDPLDPNIVFGGKVSRYDRRTDQVTNVTPNPLRKGDYRTIRTQPLVFSPADPHVLFFGANSVWKTTTGGESWNEISPDLTRKTWSVPANVGKYAKTPQAKPRQRGVVYALAPSPLDINLLWAGTDDGLIHVTTDGGKTWTDVTPPQLVPWAKVSVMEASHFDKREAWAAINTFRLDDLRPHILRTRDGGKTWKEIVDGIPAEGIVNVVREDPKKEGLLFAGTERAVYVSFDDGENWESLRLNMPATSIRDLVIHGDDVAVATHGRGFWILDDIEPLRQHTGHAETILYKPADAWRFRWDKNTDTPLPPDEPAGENPPDGAIIDYALASPAKKVVLEIAAPNGMLVRRYTSNGKPFTPADEGNVPWYWIRPPQQLSTAPGIHRFVWDLHYAPLPGSRNAYPIAAVPHDTPAQYTSPWVLPRDYTVRLVVDGKIFTQTLRVKMDPRVTTPTAGLDQQFELSRQLYNAAYRTHEALAHIGALRDQLAKVMTAKGELANEIAAFSKNAAALEGEPGYGYGYVAPPIEKETLNSVMMSSRALMSMLQSSDVAPSTQAVAAVEDRLRAANAVMQRWQTLSTSDLSRLNEALTKANLPKLDIGKTEAYEVEDEME